MYTERFMSYFDREVAQKAAKTIADGSEVEFRVSGPNEEVFTFTKSGGKNTIRAGAALDPQVVFTLPQQAANEILADTSGEIGEIGVNIAKLIVTSDANRRVSFKLKTGFLTLFSKGYFGVVTAGGAAFASYLASRGLNGISGIKAAFKKMKE